MTLVREDLDEARLFAGSRNEARAELVRAKARFLCALRDRGELPHGQITAARLEWLQRKHAALWRTSCASQRKVHGAPLGVGRAPAGRERPRPVFPRTIGGRMPGSLRLSRRTTA